LVEQYLCCVAERDLKALLPLLPELAGIGSTETGIGSAETGMARVAI